MFFFVADQEHGWEPWTSDGTIAGTWLVRDVRPGERSSFHPDSSAAAAGGRLYWSGNDGSGNRLWTSDGTADGTMPMDLSPMSSGVGARVLAADSDPVFVTGSGGIWRLDGTDAVRLGDAPSSSTRFSIQDGELYYVTSRTVWGTRDDRIEKIGDEAPHLRSVEGSQRARRRRRQALLRRRPRCDRP